MRRSARATRRDSCEKARPSRLPDDSNQWMRADTGLTGRNIDHRRRLRSCTLRWTIARFDLIRFATQIFPARLVNPLHLQVAEEAAFLHRNPTGHLNFAARSTEPCALHIAPAPTASFSKLACQFARVGNLPAGCHAPSLARGSICCVSQMVFLRQWIVFLALGSRSFCAASATPLTGFADDKQNNGKTRDGRIGYRRFFGTT